MSTIERTAYPRYSKRRKIKQAELNQYYTLTQEELDLMNQYARTPSFKLSFAIQLKTFQNLGYFIPIQNVPEEIIKHIRQTAKFHHKVSYGYQTSNNTIYNHQNRILDFLHVTRWEQGKKLHQCRKAAIKFAYETAQNMNNIPDIINAVIEFLLQSNYELPSFYTLNRLVRHTRHHVNNKIFQQVAAKISAIQRQTLATLIESGNTTYSTMFNKLKLLPKRPSIKRFKSFLDHYNWLSSLGDFSDCLSDVAKIKVEQFAEEACNMTADEIMDITEEKRFTLIASLIYKSSSDAKDVIASMLCRLVSVAHKSSKNKLQKKLNDSKEKSKDIAEILKNIAEQSKVYTKDTEYALWVTSKLNLSGGADIIISKCNDILMSHSNEHRVFLSQELLKNRGLLFRILKLLNPNSSNKDDLLVKAIREIIDGQLKRSEYIDANLNLAFSSEFWKNRIKNNIDKAERFNRKELETCVIDYVSKSLSSGDLHVEGANNYADYRIMLMPWDKCKLKLDDYCKQSCIPSNAKDMVSSIKKILIDKAKYVDDNYDNLSDFVINEEDGKPILKKYEPKPKSENAEKLELLIKERMPERGLLDILFNSDYYASWTSECGSIDGSEPKLDNPKEKYILTPFAIGTGLGFTQTAKHMRTKISPRILSRVNKKHFSIKSLNKSMVKIINCLNDFPLLNAWGTGQRSVIDGTFEDINDNNMVAENHIRYGGKGCIAYHHVADNYIALFSSFLQCGMWEAIHIIDTLLKNASEVQPKIVHADTQGQSLPVFAIAYLFGIKLMPRIRNWKDLKLYRPEKDSKFQKIDLIFCDGSIDWEMIENHWEDLMQVVISVKYGKVSSSFILSKLNSYNNKNKLYKAFQELGKVIRTAFLLDYMADKNLRQLITDTTNKVEAYNGLSAWLRFGAERLTASNNPDEMEKSIKYNSLIANSIMLQNVIDITEICYQLRQEGYCVTKNDLSYISPYLTEHIKRFGEYVLDPTNELASIDEIKARSPF